MASRWKINSDGSLYGIRGDSADIAMTWKDGEGEPIDLTGYEIAAEVRSGPRPAYKFLTFDTSDSVLEDGRIVLRLTAEETSAINKTVGVWDLQVTRPDGSVYTLIGPSCEVVIERDTTE